MPRPRSTCKLCLQTKDLEDSHFLPKGLYSYCRSTEGFEPIKVTSDLVLPTSRQTHAYLLCGECEDLLNERGESWVVPKLATWERKFPLYDLLVSAPPLFAEDDWAVYAGSANPILQVAEITHFAMGVYWKAAVHSWRGDSDEPQIDMGLWVDAVRDYLNGGAFPQGMSLAVVLSPPRDAYIGFNAPYRAAGDMPYHTYLFCVPGIWFCLFAGDSLPSDVVAISVSGPAHPILVSRSIAAKGQEAAFNFLQRARKPKKYMDVMQKIRESKDKR